MTERSYLMIVRTGLGTPPDRRKRSAPWEISADYRSRMIDARLAEPDDADREAVRILSAEAPNLSYS